MSSTSRGERTLVSPAARSELPDAAAARSLVEPTACLHPAVLAHRTATIGPFNRAALVLLRDRTAFLALLGLLGDIGFAALIPSAAADIALCRFASHANSPVMQSRT